MSYPQEKWYAVFNGREPGVYDSWPEANAQVSGFSHNCFKSYETDTAADKAYMTHLLGNRNDLSNFNNKESLQKKSYAVFQGREPGVYNSWPETHAQVTGFSQNSFKSYKTEAEAQKALATHVLHNRNGFSSFDNKDLSESQWKRAPEKNDWVQNKLDDVQSKFASLGFGNSTTGTMISRDEYGEEAEDDENTLGGIIVKDNEENYYDETELEEYSYDVYDEDYAFNEDDYDYVYED